MYKRQGQDGVEALFQSNVELEHAVCGLLGGFLAVDVQHNGVLVEMCIRDSTYMVVVGYISYFLIGIVGLASVLAGSIVTIMRIWDGVTDPFVGMMVDKTNGKFGKNRPFIVIGQIIMFVKMCIRDSGVGLCGMDGQMLRCTELDPALGHVGEIKMCIRDRASPVWAVSPTLPISSAGWACPPGGCPCAGAMKSRSPPTR